MKEDDRLYDYGDYPEINAYGLDDVHYIASDIRIILFDWKLVEGVWRRRIAGTIKRPTCSFPPEQLAVWGAQGRPHAPIAMRGCALAH